MSKFFKKSQAELKKELQAYHELLVKGVKDVTADPSDYKKFLDFVSQFPTRSLRNQILIFKQKPTASLVAGMKQWNKLGRQVKFKSKPINIIAPIKVKEKEYDPVSKKDNEIIKTKGYKKVKVFDLNDTKGVPLPLNPIIPKDIKHSEFTEKTFYPLLNELRKSLPIELDNNYNLDGNGYYSALEHKIVLNSNNDRDITNIFKTLIHEYAHSIFHNLSGKYNEFNRDTKEVQAESLAYIVNKHFGTDTSDFSFPYLKTWSNATGDKLLVKYQEDIIKESAKIIKRIEDVIIENKITFDVPAVLEQNSTSIAKDERPLSLLQFGEKFSVVEGDINNSLLNNKNDFMKIGTNFDNKDKAVQFFEENKGFFSISELNQVNENNEKINIYEKTIQHTEMNSKKMYFIGLPSMTNVKALTSLSIDLEETKLFFNELKKNEVLKFGSDTKIPNDKIQVNLSERNLESSNNEKVMNSNEKKDIELSL
ncbi:hypothetical protein BTS2_3382 [Bacillus sp. TS-2]|nr:hypothetical protein BTS2_3382 [Bacillus sp. TS-2]